MLYGGYYLVTNPSALGRGSPSSGGGGVMTQYMTPGSRELAVSGRTVGTPGGTIYRAISHAPISDPAGRNQSITYASSGKGAISHRSDVSFPNRPNLEATVYLAWPSSCTGGGHPELAIKFWGPPHTDSTCCYAYTCLSQDTEILTESGWEYFVNQVDFKSKRILCYDVINDRYFLEVPKKWHFYPQVSDTLRRIRSDRTDQLVTGNHRCLAEREGELSYIYAQSLSSRACVPYLEDLSHVQSSVSDRSIGGKETKRSSSYWIRKVLLEGMQGQGAEESNRGEKSLVERWSSTQEKKRGLHSAICRLSSRVPADGGEQGVYTREQTRGGPTSRKTAPGYGNRPSYRWESIEQQARKLDVIFLSERPYGVSQGPRSYSTTLATVTEEPYKGFVFCPTVSTAAFVVRRRGKIFLTGNSAVPQGNQIAIGVGGERR